MSWLNLSNWLVDHDSSCLIQLLLTSTGPQQMLPSNRYDTVCIDRITIVSERSNVVLLLVTLGPSHGGITVVMLT